MGAEGLREERPLRRRARPERAARAESAGNMIVGQTGESSGTIVRPRSELTGRPRGRPIILLPCRAFTSARERIYARFLCPAVADRALRRRSASPAQHPHRRVGAGLAAP